MCFYCGGVWVGIVYFYMSVAHGVVYVHGARVLCAVLFFCLWYKVVYTPGAGVPAA